MPILALRAEVVGKVTIVDQRNHLISIDFGEDHGVEEGKFVLMPTGSGYKCRMEVIKVVDEAVLASTRHCVSEDTIKVGAKVETDPYGDDRESYPPKPFMNSVGPDLRHNILEFDLEHPPKGYGDKSNNEWWYTYWGVGLAFISYPQDRDVIVSPLGANASIGHLSLAMDVLGVYLPRKNFQTMIGGVLSLVMDRYSDDSGSFQINQYLISASAVHFFGSNIGHGPFVRGDIGPAYEHHFTGGSGLGLSIGDGILGFGLLAGAGYAHPITDGTRALLMLSYASRIFHSGAVGTTSLTAGLLF